MQSCDKPYHGPKDVIGRAETMMMQDLEGDAEHGFITLDYNKRLQIDRFKVSVGRINEMLESALVQRARCQGKLI